MASETFAREDEIIMRLLQEWPDLIEIMGVAQSDDDRDPAGNDLSEPNKLPPT